MRLAVIGDVGGHAGSLAAAIITLGGDPVTGQLPEDLIICQLGDLVHRGPDSSAVLALVERFRVNSEGRWVQLLGNHEAQYTREAIFASEQLNDHDAELLRSWWESGFLRTATAFETDGVEVRRSGGSFERSGAGGLLVTHAGLTAGLWHALGEPETAAHAAELINADARMRHRDDWTGVFALGSMLTRRPSIHAGVLWAEATGEVYDSWITRHLRGEQVPGFHQAHGHSNPFDWYENQWRQPLRRQFNDSEAVIAKVLPEVRQTRVEIGTSTLFGIDPGHGRSPVTRWSPLILQQR
jgi:hypothetical protein